MTDLTQMSEPSAQLNVKAEPTPPITPDELDDLKQQSWILSHSAAQALAHLQAIRRASPGEISRALGLSLSDATRVLRELRAAGLIREIRFWVPTPAGKGVPQ